MPKDMLARAAAKVAGAVTYKTNFPCTHGHLSARATISGSCITCIHIAAKKWLAKNPSKGAAYTAAYRQRNPELAKTNDKASKQKRAQMYPELFKERRRLTYEKLAAKKGRKTLPQNRMPISVVLERLHAAHGGRITYVGGYHSMTTNAQFRCETHQLVFPSHPHNVLRGADPCPQCNHMKSSGEEQVAEYLSLFTPVVRRDRTLIKPYELDIYLPEHQIAVEYCGMYWHSHMDKEAEKTDKHKHFQKYQACAEQGIRLLTIYESEWQEHGAALRRLLRNMVGKNKGRLMARKCDLRKVQNPEARAFYDKYHPQGGAGSGEHYGLFWRDKLVACMRFSFGQNDRGAGAKERTWTLGRYATRVTVAGGASRLFKAFLVEHSPTEVKSFSDNRFFDGGMYGKLGFVLEEKVAPDYQVWSPRLGLRPKPHYQRRALPKRLLEHGVTEQFIPETDPRTEATMTYLMGCGRIYDCGKKRWLWTLDNP